MTCLRRMREETILTPLFARRPAVEKGRVLTMRHQRLSAERLARSIASVTALFLAGFTSTACTHRIDDATAPRIGGSIRLIFVHDSRYWIPPFDSEAVEQSVDAVTGPLFGSFDQWIDLSRPLTILRDRLPQAEERGPLNYFLLPIGKPDLATIQEIERGD